MIIFDSEYKTNKKGVKTIYSFVIYLLSEKKK